jgi:hypothetical protein
MLSVVSCGWKCKSLRSESMFKFSSMACSCSSSTGLERKALDIHNKRIECSDTCLTDVDFCPSFVPATGLSGNSLLLCHLLFDNTNYCTYLAFPLPFELTFTASLMIVTLCQLENEYEKEQDHTPPPLTHLLTLKNI